MILNPLAEALEESYNGLLLDARIYAKAEPLILLWGFIALALAVFLNAAWQLVRLFLVGKFSNGRLLSHQLAQSDSAAPPTVSHLFPFVGSALSYSINPVRFLSSCHKTVSVIIFILECDADVPSSQSTAMYLLSSSSEGVVRSSH